MTEHSKEYMDYINSEEWAEFVTRVKRARDNECEGCGADGRKVILQVHHLTYERLGREWLKDVQLLCVPCHRIADGERRASHYKGTSIHVRKK